MTTFVELHDREDGEPVVINFDHVQMYASRKDTNGTVIIGVDSIDPMVIVRETLEQIANLVVVARIL